MSFISCPLYQVHNIMSFISCPLYHVLYIMSFISSRLYHVFISCPLYHVFISCPLYHVLYIMSLYHVYCSCSLFLLAMFFIPAHVNNNVPDNLFVQRAHCIFHEETFLLLMFIAIHLLYYRTSSTSAAIVGVDQYCQLVALL